MYNLDQVYAHLDQVFADFYWDYTLDSRPKVIDKSKWLIVHPTANLQRERNTVRASQLWKVMPVSDVLTLIGTFYSAGITFKRPVDE